MVKQLSLAEIDYGNKESEKYFKRQSYVYI